MDYIEDVQAEYGPRLKRLGYSLEIAPCEVAPEDIADFAPQICGVSDPDAMHDFVTNKEAGLEWDFGEPMKREGLSPYSAFLYINPIEKIAAWMHEGFYRVSCYGDWEPECDEAEKVKRALMKANAEEDDEAKFGMVREILFRLSPDFENKGKSDFINEIDIDEFFYDQLGPSERNCCLFEDCYAGSAFDRHWEGRDIVRMPVTQALHSLMISWHEWDENWKKPENFDELLADATQKAIEWVREYDRTYGGELLYAKRVKERFTEEFGAPEPVAFRPLRYDYQRHESMDTGLDDAESIFILHAKDAEDMKNPEEFFNHAVNKQCQIVDGDVYEYTIMDRKDRAVRSASGFYDMESLAKSIEGDMKILTPRNTQRM